MQENNFPIGATNFNANRFGNRKWHKLEAGDNFYRILPPMFSLAADGRYSAYWSFHGGFKNSQGITQMFRCIETKDKSKLIKQHCPVCDLVTTLMAYHTRLREAQKAGQATDEQVKKFWNEQVFPIKAQKGFFVNAMNRNGEVGQLLLPYKAHQAVDQAMKSCAERNGIDPTGVKGAWINIKKVQPFKGSPDVSYGAEIVFEPLGNGSFQVKTHELTAEILQNSIKNSARDLTTMFREILPTDVAQLAGVQPEQRPALVDRIFGKPEVNVTQSPLTVQAPGTQATLVGHVEPLPNGGYQVAMPQAPSTQPTAPAQMPLASTAAPQTSTLNPFGWPQQAPTTPSPSPSFAPPPAAPQVSAPATSGFLTTTGPTPPTQAPTVNNPGNGTTVPIGQSNLGQTPSNISDQDFRSIFGQ